MDSIALTEAVFYILLSLRKPLHGYGIMQNAEALSGGRVRLAGEQEYLRFMEDAGIEQVASLGRWIYFRKRTDGGAFELFSDIDSRIKHLWRI
ncbi:MAG: DUF2812 domain-containing protein [Gordonibacter sp.]